MEDITAFAFVPGECFGVVFIGFVPAGGVKEDEGEFREGGLGFGQSRVSFLAEGDFFKVGWDGVAVVFRCLVVFQWYSDEIIAFEVVLGEIFEVWVYEVVDSVVSLFNDVFLSDGLQVFVDELAEQVAIEGQDGEDRVSETVDPLPPLDLGQDSIVSNLSER